MKPDFQFTTTGQFIQEKKTECILVKSDNWNTIKAKLAGVNLKRNLFEKLGFILIGIGVPLLIQCFIIENNSFFGWITTRVFFCILGLIIIFSGIILIVLNRNKDKDNIFLIDNIISLLSVVEINSYKTILGDNSGNISDDLFNFDQPINYRSLQEFMDYLIPEYPRSSIRDKKDLSNRIKRFGENYHSLYKYYQINKKYINDIQDDVFFVGGKKLFQYQVIESILNLSNDSYWSSPKEVIAVDDIHIYKLIREMRKRQKEGQINQSEAQGGRPRPGP